MICARCGGTIELDECCRDCGIAYSQMLEEVSHSEMRRLFKKLKDLDRHHKRSDIDESLLVCELSNSLLITGAMVEGDHFTPIYFVDKRKRKSLALCTDMKEFKNLAEIGLEPLVLSWQAVFDYIEEDEGVVINFFDECCHLDGKFLKHFFGDRLNTS